MVTEVGNAHLSVALPADATGARVARARVRRALMEWGLSAIEPNVTLVVSELVTNGFLHAGGSVDLVVSADGNLLHISVADNESDALPQELHVPPTEPGGRGMAIVADLTSRWGVLRQRPDGHPGKIVWCEIPIEE
jgi:anti-sigma regulatory factor (Ser/Thr protein kinase)